MGVWAQRRYRLVAAVIAGGVLVPLGLAVTYASTTEAARARQTVSEPHTGRGAGLPARELVESAEAEEPGGTPEVSPEPVPEAAEPVEPTGPELTAPTTPPSGVTPVVTRLALGTFDVPAPGVTVAAGSPDGVLVPEPRARRTTRGPRTLSLVRASTAPFRAAAVTWAANHRLGGVRVSLRGHRPGGDWGPWHQAGVAEESRDPVGGAPATSRGGAELIWLGHSDGVELAVTSVSGQPPADLALDLIDPMDAASDAIGANPADPATPGAARVAAPPILRRAAWGADERLMTWRPRYARTVKAVVLHHTATGNDYTEADVPKLLRAIYQYHAVSRGWGDIGYNVLVDRFGRLWEGRAGGLSRPVVGAHAGGFNTGTTGLAMIGDHRTVPVAQGVVESAARYVAWKFGLGPAANPRGTVTLIGGGYHARYPANTKVNVPRVYPHRLTSATECPGARGMDILGPLRDRAYTLLGDLRKTGTVRAKLSTWRPAEARWRVRGTAEPVLSGTPGDVPVPADYDGDGRTDLATWTPSTGTWRIVTGDGTAAASGAPTEQFQLGAAGDVPAPADFDGDGRVDPATFTPDSGVWRLRDGTSFVWGQRGDRPVPADYNGDGRADPAVFRPASGMWYMRGVGESRLGRPWHIPVPADYNGDGRAEPATWSTTTHRWFIRGQAPIQFGARGDVPIPAQYDGDGRADLAVFHGRSGAGASWQVRGIGSYGFGSGGEIPLPLS